MTLIAVVIQSHAITFDRKYFKPNGKNFTGSINHLYYWPTDKTTDKVTMLYYKTSTGVCIFKGFEISKSLEERLPMLVIKYIGRYITGPKLTTSKSLSAAIDATKKAVDIALDQKYKNLILNEGKILVQDSGYYRGHFHSKWWMPNYYYDYVPAFSDDSVKNFLTNSVTDARFPHLKYVSDSLKLLNYHHDTKSVAKWGHVFKKVRNSLGRKLSDWAFVKSTVSNSSGFHKNNDSCRFTLISVSMTHGKKYPIYASVSIFGWHATYCNFYASDLRKLVFGQPFYSTKGCKTDYGALTSDVNFVEIPKSDIHKYSQLGYFVFLIDEGHVASIFPDSNEEIKVIQAGDKTGIFELKAAWPAAQTSNAVRCYLLLGHIKKEAI
jgi:hypothetical protein